MHWLLSARNNLLTRLFDWRYHVRTCGEENPRELTVVGENVTYAVPYIPTTPWAGRRIFRDLPVSDVSSYTFIDMGSGKGRMLLLAAELPFRRIIGVEFATDLDALARKNANTYRNKKQACFQIEPVNMDAAQFKFPPEPSFIYFFYPFEQEVMEPVIQNLNRSLAEHPRDVVLLYRNPILSDVVEAASNLKVHARRNYLTVYRSAI
jgi:SAM-dependent methyltransferase